MLPRGLPVTARESPAWYGRLEMPDYYALVPVLLPIAGGLLISLARGFPEKIQRGLIIGLMAFLLVMNLAYFIALEGGMVSPAAVGPIVLDAPGAFISCLVAFLGVLVLVYSLIYRRDNHFDATFFILYFVLAGTMCGMACTYNVLVMLVFLEAATVTSAVLILFGKTKKAIKATYIYLALSIVEVILVIYGSFILYGSTGTLDLRFMDISRLPPGDTFLLALLFLFGFGTKAGLLPLGIIWLPPAHADAPAPISATMSGILIKASVIAMVKAMYPFFLVSGASTLVLIVAGLGVLNMFAGVIMALLSMNIKRLLAYHSVSQMGYIVMGFGFAVPMGIYGALFHVMNHMLFKGCLFLITGALLLRVNTRQIHKMGGLLKKMPVTGICFLTASLAMSGLPSLNGFLSKEAIYEGSVEAGFPVLFTIAGQGFTMFSLFGWATSILTFICLVHAFIVIFLGKPKGDLTDVKDPPAYMLVPIVVLASLCVIIGLFPGLVSASLHYIAEMVFLMKGG